MTSSIPTGTVELSTHPDPQVRTLALAAQIISAHVANNRVACTELPGLVRQVCSALLAVGTAPGPAPQRRPAVPVSRSVFPGYIICLENGRPFKTLRRHLMAAYGLTPEQYRRRWGLAPDYPMIAPDYEADRSSLAKATRLGHAPARTRPASSRRQPPAPARSGN